MAISTFSTFLDAVRQPLARKGSSGIDPETAVLMALANGGRSLAEIGRSSGLSLSQLAGAVPNLERLGLIQRDTADQSLFLTDVGMRYVGDLRT